MPMCLVHSRGLDRQWLMKITCLIFDEMKIRENLNFSQKFGCIEGLWGPWKPQQNKWYCRLYCGLRKKWKQLVAYYLIERSYNVRCLLICWCLSQCGTGSSCQQSQGLEMFGCFRKDAFLEVQNWEIAPIFDPVHLLKCASNLFLKHDVADYCEWWAA